MKTFAFPIWLVEYAIDDVSFKTSKDIVCFTQINDMRYDVEMKEDGIHDILKFGIAFSGKKVALRQNKIEIRGSCRDT